MQGNTARGPSVEVDSSAASKHPGVDDLHHRHHRQRARHLASQEAIVLRAPHETDASGVGGIAGGSLQPSGMHKGVLGGGCGPVGVGEADQSIS